MEYWYNTQPSDSTAVGQFKPRVVLDPLGIRRSKPGTIYGVAAVSPTFNSIPTNFLPCTVYV